MPSRKRSRTPPAAPAAASGVPVRTPVPSLRETFERRHFLAFALVLVASAPAVLGIFWSAVSDSDPVVVGALLVLALAAWLVDQEQWATESRRQMFLTLGFGGIAAATVPAVPLGLFFPTLVATVLEFRRGWGAASALVLGSGVGYALFAIEPTTSYPYVLGMAWPALGAAVMRRIVLAGTEHGPLTVLGRGRW